MHPAALMLASYRHHHYGGKTPPGLLAIAIILFIVICVVAYAKDRPRRPKLALGPLARPLALRLVGKRLVGQRGGAEIVITASHARGVLSLRHPGVPTDIQLAREGQVPSRDFQTGHDAFDRLVRIGGTAAWRVTLLSKAGRDAVTDAILAGWTLADGSWRHGLTDASTATEIDALIAVGLDLADRLSERDDEVHRLAVAARSGPSVARLAALDAMVAQFGGHPATGALARQLVSDLSPAIRLWAASFLGDVPVIAQVASNRKLAPDLRAAAVRALARHPSAPEASAVADHLLTDGRGPALALALVELLGAVPHPRGEAALLDAITAEEEALVMAALRSLGAIATGRAVPPLRELAAARPRLRGPVAEAVARIQTRAQSAAGGVALALAVGGELALSRHE
ncbi:MAG: hypothetical protein U1F43_26960 [Myxococcota bacterium]